MLICGSDGMIAIAFGAWCLRSGSRAWGARPDAHALDLMDDDKYSGGRARRGGDSGGGRVGRAGHRHVHQSTNWFKDICKSKRFNRSVN